MLAFGPYLHISILFVAFVIRITFKPFFFSSFVSFTWTWAHFYSVLIFVGTVRTNLIFERFSGFKFGHQLGQPY